MSYPYIDLSTLPQYSSMPSADIAALDAAEPGFIVATIASKTSEIHSRIGKRYAWPFQDPTPAIVLDWLGALVTPELYTKRGANPQDQTIARIDAKRDLAESQMKEAADSDTGLFELPLREDASGANGIVKGGPYGYSEQSPYEWMDLQADAVGDRWGRR